MLLALLRQRLAGQFDGIGEYLPSEAMPLCTQAPSAGGSSDGSRVLDMKETSLRRDCNEARP